jgi:hypothetical protein
MLPLDRTCTLAVFVLCLFGCSRVVGGSSAGTEVRSDGILEQLGTQQTTAPAIEYSKFQSLYRAARRIEAGISLGLSVPRFSELLESLATEQLLSMDACASATETEFSEQWRGVVVLYTDSLTLWRASQTQRDRRTGIGGIADGDIAVVGDVNPIVSRYGFKVEGRQQDFGAQYDVISEDSIQVLWSRAATVVSGIVKAHPALAGR